MVWYFLNYFLIFFLGVVGFFKEKSTAYIKPIAFCILFLFAFSKGEFAGWDSHSYVLYFHKVTKASVSYLPDNITFFEPAYFFIPYMSKLLVGKHFIALSFAVFAFLGIALKLKSFYLSNSEALSLILYTGTFFMLHEMTQIRVGVAAGLFLCAIRYIQERNMKLYFLFIFMACLFHYSSFILFFLYFLNPHVLQKKLYVFLIGGSVLLSILGLSILNPNVFSFIPKIQAYLELSQQSDAYDELKTWNNPGFWINLILTLVLFYFSDSLQQKNKYFIILLKINILSVVAYLALAAMPVVAGRLSQLFAIVQIVLYPSVIYIFKERKWGYAIVIFISLLYIYNYTLRVPIVHPYYTWW